MNNIKLKEFVWDPTAGTATKPLVLKTPQNTLYYLHDANKNVIGLTSDSCMSIAHYEYDTFGNLTTPTLNIDNPFCFSSEYFDSELSLIYYNYRHYNPQSGRWISRDPIEEIGGNNLYGMCKNNIIVLTDILGYATQEYVSDIQNTPCQQSFEILVSPATLPGAPASHGPITFKLPLIEVIKYTGNCTLLCYRKIVYECIYEKIITIREAIQAGLTTLRVKKGIVNIDDLYKEERRRKTAIEHSPCIPFL